MHILVVEDDLFLQKVYERRLEEADHTVVVCGSGEDALEAVRERVPDLIMLDLVLPGKDGFSIVQTLRDMPDTQAIPIIMLTNIDREIDRERGLQLGATAYITKAEVEEGSLAAIVQQYGAQ